MRTNPKAAAVYADKLAMAQALQEKRCGIRLFADNEVIVSVPNCDGEIISERTILTDVSIDGVNFVTRHYEYYHSWQPIMLQIVMPGEGHENDITAFGRVVWLSDPDVSTCGEVIQPRIGVNLNHGEMSRLLHG